MEHPFGIDFGGTGIKGAPVDLEAGDFAARADADRHPAPSHPAGRRRGLRPAARQFPDSTRPVGVTVPGVVRHGVVHSAANIDKSLDRRGRRRALHRGHRSRGARRQRRGRRGPRRGGVRRREGPRRTGHRHHARHRHRLGARLRRRRWCPTPSSATSRSTATTPRRATATSAREREDLSWEDWAERLTAYYRTSSGCSPPTCSWSAAASASRADKFLPPDRHRDRDRPRRRCATAPASSAPRSWRTAWPASRTDRVRRPGRARGDPTGLVDSTRSNAAVAPRR